MNGGVLNCCQDVLSEEELQAATDGYRYFGLSRLADLLNRAKLVGAADADEAEAQLDADYAALVPDDDSLVQKFRAKFQEDPAQFGPPP